MASRRVRVGGVWVSKPEYVRIGGAWVLKNRFVRVSGAWAPVTSLSAAPNPCVGSASGFAPSGFVTSQSCVVSGFSGAVSWARISGSTAHNINNASGTTVSWSGTVPGNTTSVWRVTNAGTTFDVTVQLNWVNLS